MRAHDCKTSGGENLLEPLAFACSYFIWCVYFRKSFSDQQKEHVKVQMMMQPEDEVESKKKNNRNTHVKSRLDEALFVSNLLINRASCMVIHFFAVSLF